MEFVRISSSPAAENEKRMLGTYGSTTGLTRIELPRYPPPGGVSVGGGGGAEPDGGLPAVRPPWRAACLLF